MSKYTLISKELDSINEARFQQICNIFLKAEYGGTLHSPGTVPNKEKTRKGKPDTYILLPGGKYILTELTTQDPTRRKSLRDKLERDLRDCLKFKSLGIKSIQVKLIALCCNGTLLPEDYEYLQAIAHPFPLTVHGIQDLTFYLYNKGKVAARDLLGISIDTGQVLTREQFLVHYHRKNLSTPLNTTLLGRQRELNELNKSIAENKLVVVKGPAGVGKSRLVLDAIDSFLAENSGYIAYYIFDKQISIAEDLLSLIEPDCKYLFFVDDANRQIQNFFLVLNNQLDSDNRQIKIVATVRDYARDEVLRACRDMKPFVYGVHKLKRETIIEIIEHDFGIVNINLQNRIANVSEGNPRLAIMAALALKEGNGALLDDVSSIYDGYFQTIIDEKEIFRNLTYLKALGLLAYFHAIDLESEWVKQMLKDFGISFDSFFEICHRLEEMEVVEIYHKYTVKISEQVMSTYFFYRVFFKEAILSFPKLLEHYVTLHAWRMRESFYSANNTFGAERVFVIAKPWLENYFNHVKQDEEIRQKFLEIFGIYLPMRVYSYVSTYINSLPVREVNSQMLEYFETRSNYHTEDPIIKILEPFFNSDNSSMVTTAVDLSLHYVEKNPDVYRLLLDKFKSLFIVKEEDGSSLLMRQIVLFGVVGQKIGNSLLINRLYFETGMAILIDNYFPGNTFIRNSSGRAKPIPELKQLREEFWISILKHYKIDVAYSQGLLVRYLEKIKEYNVLFYYLDAPFIKEIIDKHLSPQQFGDTFFVYHYRRILKKLKVKLPWLNATAETYHTPAIEIYIILMRESDKNINSYQRYCDWGKVSQSNINRIRKALPTATIRDYKKVYAAVHDMVKCQHIQKFNGYPSFEYYLAGIIQKDTALGYRVLTHYLEQGNEAKISPTLIYRSFKDKGGCDYEKLYKLLCRFPFFNKEEWLHQFFQLLPEVKVNSKWVNELVAFFQSVEEPITLWVSGLASFIACDPEIIVSLLNILSNKREADKSFTYKLEHDFFKENRVLVSKHFDLCAKVYLQLEEMNHHFDFDAEDFIILYEQNTGFLQQYINYLLVTNQFYLQTRHKSLEKLWHVPGSEVYIQKALMQLTQNEHYYIGDHLANRFFINLQASHRQKAYELLQSIIVSHPADRKILDMVFDIARNCLGSCYQQLIKYFLQLNPDFKLFEKIQLLNNHWSGTGNEIWSDFKAAELNKIYSTVKAIAGHQYYEHLLYLEQRIVWEEENSKEERKLQFMGWR